GADAPLGPAAGRLARRGPRATGAAIVRRPAAMAAGAQRRAVHDAVPATPPRSRDAVRRRSRQGHGAAPRSARRRRGARDRGLRARAAARLGDPAARSRQSCAEERSGAVVRSQRRGQAVSRSAARGSGMERWRRRGPFACRARRAVLGQRRDCRVRGADRRHVERDGLDTRMTFIRQPVAFACGQDWLLGVVTRPEKPRSRGVLVAVGGPQYRAGSHRQFVLLANDLAAQGYAVMRFDYRGMGDSTGEPRTFENVEEDLRAAVDHFLSRVPEVTEVVVWGLCDAASAALFYSHRDRRVAGIALLNPWVRTAQGEARAHLKHYYLRRAFSAAPWAKLLRGQFDLAASALSFMRNLKRASAGGEGALPERMAYGLARFKGRALLI